LFNIIYKYIKKIPNIFTIEESVTFSAFGGFSVTADTIGARTRESATGKRYK